MLKGTAELFEWIIDFLFKKVFSLYLIYSEAGNKTLSFNKSKG